MARLRPARTRTRASSSVRRPLVASGLVAALVVGLFSASQPAVAAEIPDVSVTTLGTETFSNATMASPNWVKPSGNNMACLTAGTDTEQLPVPGCGATPEAEGDGVLRFTTAENNKVGTVYSTVSVPTAQGLSLSFNSYQYGFTGTQPADGIAFILAATDPANPSAPETTGPLGGSLGYSATLDGLHGVAHGYLGFGLDVFGNFANSQFGGTGCASRGAQADSLTVRGPGNAGAGYCVLATTHVGDNVLNDPDDVRPDPVEVEIAINPAAEDAITTSGLIVGAGQWALEAKTPDGIRSLSGNLPDAATVGDHVPAEWINPETGVPYQLALGWAASTGGSNNVHEISRFGSVTVNGPLPVYELSVTDDGDGALLADSPAILRITPSLDPDEGVEENAATVTTTLPSELTPRENDFTTDAGYACSALENTVTCSYTPDAPVEAGGSLPTLEVPIHVTAEPGTYTVNAKVSSRDANPATAVHTVEVVEFGAAPVTATIEQHLDAEFRYTGLPGSAAGSVRFSDADGETLCEIADVSAAEHCSAGRLAVGETEVTAEFVPAAGSGFPSATATTAITVEPTKLRFEVTIEPSAIAFGERSTLSVSSEMTDRDPLPGLPADATGRLDFVDAANGDQVLCSITAAERSCQTAEDLVPRDAFVTARYSQEDDRYIQVSSSTDLLSISRAQPDLRASVSSPTIQFGQANTISFSGLPSSGATAATGNVTFTEIYPGSGNLPQNRLCVATLPDTSCTTPADLPVGTYEFSAIYLGDSNYRQASSAVTRFEVVRADADLHASAASPETVYGSTNTLSHSGVPAGATGTVTFTDADGNELCEATLPDTSCSTSEALAAGSYDVTASYSGDARYAPGDAEPFTIDVIKREATITVTAARNPIVFGEGTTVSHSGLATSGETQATGTVVFTADGRELCSVDLPDTSCSIPGDLPTGSHSIVAEYSGDANNEPSASAPLGLEVDKAPVALDASAAAPVTGFGQSNTLSYAGLPVDAGSLEATGEVTFTAGGTELCVAELPALSCETPASLAAGSYTVTASYSGDSNYESAQAEPFEIAVSREATASLSGAASPNPASYGTPVTVSHTGLTLAGELEATGTVAFETADGTELCSVTLPETACAIEPPLPAGAYSVVARYSGDDNHDERASEPFTLEVVAADVQLTAAGPESIEYGSSATLTVHGPTDAATGTITFTDADGTVLCETTLPDTACATAPSLAAGEYTVTATYSGDSNHNAATSESFTLVVGERTAPEFAATATPDATPFATPSTLAYSGLVTTGAAPATGTVTFTAGDIELCTTALPDTSCSTPADLPAGEYGVNASYSGDANNAAATAETSFVVERAQPTIDASAGSASVVYGEQNTLSFTGLTLDGQTSATGTVVFSVGDEVLCEVELPATSCQTSTALEAGAYEVTATYSGDDNHEGASADTEFEVTRAEIADGAVPDLASVYGYGTNVFVFGLPVDGPNRATGTIEFTADDGTVLCTATLPSISCELPSDLPAGEHAITANYSGDRNHEPASIVGTWKIKQAPTAVVATPKVNRATEGQPVRIDLSGIPADATGTATVRWNERVLCTVTLPASHCVAPSDLAIGSYTVQVEYGGDHNHAPSTTTAMFSVVEVPHRKESVVARPAPGGDRSEVRIPLDLPSGATAEIVGQPEHGTVSIVDGELVYIADPGYSGEDTITYRIVHPDGSSELVTVRVSIPEASGIAATGAGGAQLTIGFALLLLAAGVVLMVSPRLRRGQHPA